MVLENLRDKIHRYFWFTPEEALGVVITILVLSFIYSFDKWGTNKFDAGLGLQNWLVGAVLFGAIVLIHHSVQRIAALHYGFQPEHSVWWYGLLGGILLAVLSNGAIKIYTATGLMISMLPAHRLGRFRYGPNVQTFANICALGLVGNLCAAAIVKTLSWILPIPEAFVNEWFVQNLVFAAWNLLPIPPLDGSRILYGSRLFYIFVFGTFAGYAILALAGIFSFVFALLIGIIAWFLFYYFVEK